MGDIQAGYCARGTAQCAEARQVAKLLIVPVPEGMEAMNVRELWRCRCDAFSKLVLQLWYWAQHRTVGTSCTALHDGSHVSGRWS